MVGRRHKFRHTTLKKINQPDYLFSSQAPKVAKRQGTFAVASSSRASDLSLIIVPGVGL
jgi:hypothetical protein